MGITEQQYRQLLDNQARAQGRALAKPKRQPGDYRSKTEAAYAGYLEILRRTGLVLDWRYEPVTLKLAEKVRYTPDFLVLDNSGLWFAEVKGRKLDSFWSRPVGKVKVRMAAALFPWWRFAVVWPMGAAWDSWDVPGGAG